jgi:adenosine deaminase
LNATKPNNPLFAYLAVMPKAEIHVHFQGATRPETLLKLAKRNNIVLPATTIEGLRDWYRFRDFDHFISIYVAICQCYQSPDDIELAMHEFIQGQADQNIRYTEMTYTPNRWLPFDEQIDAINRARQWGESQLNTLVNLVIDVPRDLPAEVGIQFAEWAISGRDRGVVAFGIGGGPENAETTRKFASAFALAKEAGLPRVPHAGEHDGPNGIRAALEVCDPVRLGHGVRCVEDPSLMAEIRERGIVLETNPTSNVLLGVCRTLADHPLPRLIDAGLITTVNTDDPPMFNVTLNDEYRNCVTTFGWDATQMENLALNAVRAALLPVAQRSQMEADFRTEFIRLRREYSI